MKDVRVRELAARQFNRFSRQQLLTLGISLKAVDKWLTGGELIVKEQGVFAIAPALDDDWGSWMGATLTAPDTSLSHSSATRAWELSSLPSPFETVTRPGSGGPRRHGGVLVYRSSVLAGDCTQLRGIPITTVARTILDCARMVSDKALARLVREAVRLEKVTLCELGDVLGRHQGRRGSRTLANTISRYAGLPLDRARSRAEIRAMEVLREAGRPLPRLNARIAGEEADLSWPQFRLIAEIDGGPFHLDVGEDARKQAVWEAAGWIVRRLPSEDVYEHPRHLLALAPPETLPRPETLP